MLIKRKIVHLLHHDKFTGPFIDFIENNFIRQDHIFFLSGGIEYHQSYSYNNVVQLHPGKKKFSIPKIINDFKYTYFVIRLLTAKKIIIHGLFNQFFIETLYKYERVLKKSNWIIWGGDLHGSNLDIITEGKKKYLIQKLHAATGIDGDIKFAKEKYLFCGVQYKAYYINPINIKEPINIPNQKNNSVKINILVGNSATPTNRHKEILLALKKFRNNNISIIVPLTYGNEAYKKDIIETGNTLFGKKFIPLCDHLEPDEYLNILQNIDVAIFNFNRQQGIHTINALLALGKKVFLPKNVSTWEFYKNDVKLMPYDFDSIEEIDFMEFINNEFSVVNSIHSTQFFYSESKLVSEWDKLFN